MTSRRIRRTPFLVLLLALILPTVNAVRANAFHSGGVGDCIGCHSIHRPDGGIAATGNDNSISLMASDPGSTCLKCHQKSGEKRPSSYLVATADEDMPSGFPPAQLTPGGDFGWLKKSYRWGDGAGSGGESSGEGHGHNIVAVEYRFNPDAERSSASGASFPSGRLSCISCHDPHGKYRRFADGSIAQGGLPIQASGSYDSSPDPTGTTAVGVYRMLGGKGYASSLYDGSPFTVDPPAAVAPENYNRIEDHGETRVAYGKGMAEWCGNCHAGQVGGAVGKMHPAGINAKFSAASAANYNAYVASGNLTGNVSTSYSSMVPFEMGTADYTLLKGTAGSSGARTAGPGTSSNVMCLSCHRAHASGWDHAMRWNMKSEFLVYNGNYPGIDDSTVPARISQGRTRAETRKAYYDRPQTAYATYQRSFCNKCHAKD